MAKKKKKGPSPANKNEEKLIAEKKKEKRISIILISVIAVIITAAIILVLVFNVPHDESSTSQSQNSVQTITDVDDSKTYTAEIKVKDYGTIKVDLNAKAAPITVQNFVKLATSGFYDGLTFHRIMNDFMMQGGDPLADGTGGADETIKGEFAENGYSNPLSHTRGAISMARNSYDMNSASSQFFIVQSDSNTAYLDGKYAAFGYVTEGMNIVDKICEEAQPIDENGTIERSQQPVIESIRISEKEN